LRFLQKKYRRMTDLVMETVTTTAREEELEALVTQWIAYASKLEKVLRMVADLSDDQLKRMQAAEGLRIVKPGGDHTGRSRQ
jgi:hypothetical protein